MYIVSDIPRLSANEKAGAGGVAAESGIICNSHLHLHFISEVIWKFFSLSRYYMPTLTMKKSKGDAKIFCADLGGHLVALETPEENAYISSLVFKTGKSDNL